MTPAKIHYAVTQKHWVSGTPDGLKLVERAGPVCNHVGAHNVNLTAEPPAVTCTRCRVYLARIEGWEKERTRPQLTTNDRERLMLDVLCDRLDSGFGMRYGLDSLIQSHPKVYAALLDALRDDMDRDWLSEQAMQAEETAEEEEGDPC